MTKDREVEIAGLTVTVVPDEGLRERMIRERGIMACVRVGVETPFHDNLTGSCIACEHGVQYRPCMPTDVAKFCVQCVSSLPEGAVQAKADAFYGTKTRKPRKASRPKRGIRTRP